MFKFTAPIPLRFISCAATVVIFGIPLIFLIQAYGAEYSIKYGLSQLPDHRLPVTWRTSIRNPWCISAAAWSKKANRELEKEIAESPSQANRYCCNYSL